MATEKHADAVVLGAGPGGYVAAIRLGQLGKQTILVERDRLGGVCLNVGCIPSKALIHAAKVKKTIAEARTMGIEVGEVRIDLAKLQQWKAGVVDKLRSGIAYLCKGNKVEVIQGEGRFNSPNEIEVQTANGKQRIHTENTIIATGSRPMEIPGFKFDGRKVISSTEALELTQIPKDFVVIGGGVTGLEIGTMLSQLGSKLTVIELLEQLLPGTDPELVRVVQRSLQKLGATIYTKATAKGYANGKVSAQLSDGKNLEVDADLVMVSVGRRPNSDNLDLERAGVQTDAKGFVRVNQQMRTNISTIYAIGDIVGPPMLAHKASKEGIVAAEVISGLNAAADFRAMPSVIFTDPEIGSVGLTETQAREGGYEFIIGRFPFGALGRALIHGNTEGFVKIVAYKKTDQVLGVHIVGPNAADLISEAAFAIEMGATVEDIGLTIHPHPTLPESIMEAAEAAKNKAIHILRT